MKNGLHSLNYKSLILGTAILSAFINPTFADYNYSQYNSGEILL